MDELESSIGDKLDALMVKRMNKLDTSIGAKFDALRMTINTELSDVRRIATGARELEDANAKAIESMEQRINNVCLTSRAGVSMTLLCTHGRVSGPNSLLDHEVIAPCGYSVPCQF